MGKQKIISAIKTFRNEVNNKLLPGKDREKITAFNKRVENVIEKLSSDNFEDFREEGQIKIIRLKLETCIEGLEATISEKKTTNIIENEAKNILNSNGFNYFDNPEQEKKSKKLASVFLIREIIKDLFTFSEEEWISNLKKCFKPIESELSNLPPARGKELENLLFAATIRDFSFDPQSNLVQTKAEKIFQKVKRFNQIKANQIENNNKELLKKQISEIWQSLSYIKALGKQLEFKFFDNKNEILELSEKIGSILTSSRPLIEGEYDEDIEEISILPLIYWKENNNYIIPLKSSTCEINIKKFKKDGKNKPPKPELSEIEGWENLSPQDQENFSLAYENGTKNFAQIKLEIEQKLASEKNQNPPKNFTEFSQEAEQEARQKETQTETELDEEINQTTTNLDDELKKISKLDQKVNERKYEERRREIEQIKKKAAQEDAIKTSQVLARNLEAQMNANEVALTELEISIKEKYNFLKSGQIKDPQEIVNSERQISQAIGEKGSTKRWEKLTKRAEKLLQNSLSEKADLDQLLRDLILFSKSTNIWDQNISKSKHWNKLKNQLESALNSQGQNSHFPWKIVLPLVFGLIFIIVVGIAILKKRRHFQKHKKMG